MAFDISTAKPDTGGFDISTATPVSDASTVKEAQATGRKLPPTWSPEIPGIGKVKSFYDPDANAYLLRMDGGQKVGMIAKDGDSLKVVEYKGKRSALGNDWQNFGAGIGKAFVDTGRGIGQLLGMDNQAEIDDAKARDAELMDTKAGIAGNIAGHAAMYLAPASLLAKTALGAKAAAALASVPKTAALLPAAVGGGLYAATQPVESGGSRGLNIAIGAAGGAAGQRLGNQLGAFVSGIKEGLRGGAQTIDAAISSAAANAGISADHPVLMGLKEDVKKALSSGGELDEAALKRAIDFKLTGVQPTTAQLTRSPMEFAREKRLAGVEGVGEDLAARFNQQPRQMLESIKAIGGNAPDAYDVGQTTIGALQGYNKKMQGVTSDLYNQAKQSAGRDLLLAPQKMTDALESNPDWKLKSAFLPDKIRTMFNDFASGKTPLDVNTAEQFKTILATASRGSTDGNERAAIGMVRDAIENTPLISEAEGASGGVGRQAIDAFNKARSFTRQYKGQIESIPALGDVIEGKAAPDNFVKNYVTSQSAKYDQVKQMVDLLNKNTPEAKDMLRNHILDFLKDRALNGASEDIGKFSSDKYNKALAQIGDRKLALFMQPEEIAKLKALGRVAENINIAPPGSSVNTSNTAANVLNLLKKSGNVLSAIPFGEAAITAPARNIAKIGERKAVKQALQAGLPVSPELLEYRGNALQALGVGGSRAGQ